MKVVVAALALVSVEAFAQFCPSYTLSSASNTAQCGIEAAAGTNPTPAEWKVLIGTTASGPAMWDSTAPAISTIGIGCNKPTPNAQIVARFPEEILQPLFYQESTWRQFCIPSEPADQKNKPSQTIIAFDCGYGIAQVTSGMHIGETPQFDRNRVAAEPLYNMQAGMQILASKWVATSCVGDNQPPLIEHWYAAAWAYNGNSLRNNPANPMYSSTRGEWVASVGGSVPYQERIWGRLNHPPSANHWAALALAYPNISQFTQSTTKCPEIEDPDCVGPIDCSTHRQMHRSVTFSTVNYIDGGLPPLIDGGIEYLGDGGFQYVGGTTVYYPDGGLVHTDKPEGRVASGCGCNSSMGAIVLLALAWLASRKKRKLA